MKYLLLMLIALFGFSGCAGTTPEPITVYKDRNITKLQSYGKLPKIPPKAKIDKPIAIREAIQLPNDKRREYVAVKTSQLVNASKVSLTTRNRLHEAVDGLKFYKYQNTEWNKTYTNNR